MAILTLRPFEDGKTFFVEDEDGNFVKSLTFNKRN
jgi:hypothetical protein